MNYFSTRYSYDKGRKNVWRAVCEYLQKFVPQNSAVLDFGAGYCDFINQIKAAKKIAVDTNPESQKYCGKGVTFYSSIDSVIRHSVKVDVIFMSNVLEHMDDEKLDDLFVKISRIIKLHGIVLIIQPNYYYSYRNYWDDYTHKKAFSHTSLKDFLNSKRFEIVRLEKKFLPFTMKSILPKSYFMTKLFLLSPFKFFAGQMLVVARYK